MCNPTRVLRKLPNQLQQENELIAVDKVFYALDSKQFPESYRSPLIDKITTTSINKGTGETEYFKFKCYGNGNLHLEFKRMDLGSAAKPCGGGATLRGYDIALDMVANVYNW